MFTLANINRELLDKLMDVNKENAELKTVLRHVPTIAIQDYMLPLTYFRFGETDTIPSRNAGSIEYTQDVTQRFLVGKLQSGAGLDAIGMGYGKVADAHDLIDVVRKHYLDRPYLDILGGIHPDLPDPVEGVLDDIELEHRCMGVRYTREVDGNWYVSFDFILNVPIFANRD